jgi:catechol 2,3-dioxygenase-like lactoylglutathione lyase family enzyme
MKIKGLFWLGTYTEKFQETIRFYQEVFGLEPRFLRDEVVIFELENGDRVEVFGPSETGHAWMKAPEAGFLVDDVESAREEMSAAGIEFIGPIHSAGSQTWSHFKGPDGHIYEITAKRTE